MVVESVVALLVDSLFEFIQGAEGNHISFCGLLMASSRTTEILVLKTVQRRSKLVPLFPQEWRAVACGVLGAKVLGKFGEQL